MAIGALVGIPELQGDGLARLCSTRPGWATVVFLTSGAEMTLEQSGVVRYALLPETRVEVQVAGDRQAARVLAIEPARAAGGLLRYRVALAAGTEEVVGEDAIVAVPSPRDASEALRTAAFHDLTVRTARAGTPLPPEPGGPLAQAAREDLLAWRDRGWADSGGVIALAGARLDLLPHQILTARRVLADRQLRFLLADEVGLGKTIEAGLVLQSLLAMQPSLRVLVVVPGALLGQWFLELYLRFGGRRFRMLDEQRVLAEREPWAGQFTLVSSRALEGLSGARAVRFAAQRWDVAIVDECHRMQPGGVLYQRIAVLSRRSPMVLLLSATPPMQHADAYLALLHLLQPEAYRLEDAELFAAKLRALAPLGGLLRRLREDPDAEALRRDLAALLPHDAEALRLLGAGDPEGRRACLAWLREHHQLNHRVIRHSRRMLARLARDGGWQALALGERSLIWVDYAPDAVEQAVRHALEDYRLVLAGTEGPSVRSLHWLLQLELASAHPRHLERLLAMRAAVLSDPEGCIEYRDQCAPGEDLRAVLRSDLSEGEVATQVAISAACVDDPAAEAAALQRLITAAAAWARRVPARCKAMLAALQRFWQEHPDEKVLIFTTHALSVRELAAALAKELGEAAIATFGAHQDEMQREEEAARFRDHPDCLLLVADALGGEGRNFQFASLVMHYDLPWSISAIEQRIGRVDRLGRDGPVPSYVCRSTCPQAIDAAWARVVDLATSVFTLSSSGLEFVAVTLEERALAEAGRGGAAALAEVQAELCAVVDHERAGRDADEDELYGQAGEDFDQAAGLAAALTASRPPLDACCRWLRALGGGVRHEEERPRAWRLRRRAAAEPRRGVFEREVALRHPKLDFFARGHELIDHLLDEAAAAGWSAVNAWKRRPLDGIAAWEGLRAVCCAELDLGPLVAAGLPLTTLRRLFTLVAPGRELLLLRADGRPEEEPALRDLLTPPFDPRRGDGVFSAGPSRSAWANPLVQGQTTAVRAWQERVKRATSAAQERGEAWCAAWRTQALARLEAGLAGQRALLDSRCELAAAGLPAGHPELEHLVSERADELRQNEVLLAAIAGARPVLDSLAWVQVDQGGPVRRD